MVSVTDPYGHILDSVLCTEMTQEKHLDSRGSQAQRKEKALIESSILKPFAQH
jgi:hypothetical protein